MDTDVRPYQIEFHFGDKVGDTDALRRMALSRLDRLAKGNKDLINASVVVVAEGRGETPHRFRARIMLEVRPHSVVSHQVDEEPELALRGALEAAERQVRDKRDELGRPWEIPKNQELS